MITPEQCRAARGLLDWSQAKLAAEAGVGIVTVRHFEAGAHDIRRATREVIARAFKDAGVEFIDGNGGGPGSATTAAPKEELGSRRSRVSSSSEAARESGCGNGHRRKTKLVRAARSRALSGGDLLDEIAKQTH